MKNYRKRITDSSLEQKLEAFGATLIVGPKGCGRHRGKGAVHPDRLIFPKGRNSTHRDAAHLLYTSALSSTPPYA